MNLSSIISYIILGFIQGLTEPLPISSSGHVMIISNLINSKIDIELLSIMTNFGSLIAIIYLYRKRLIELIKDFFSYLKDGNDKTKKSFRYVILLIVGTIPAGIFGLIVSATDIFEKLEQNIKFVGVTLLVTALLLFLIRNIKGKKDDDKITLKDAIIIGFFQVLALLPGISRSGATIVGGMTRNLKRETAFDFSFMLYIPISLATMILGLKDLLGSNLDSLTIIFYIIATIIAGFITYFATKWFRNIVKNGKLIYFVIYCLIVGMLVILFL